MIVVSDTSPLNYLLLIGAVDVLPKLFDSIYAPNAVLGELADAQSPPIVASWAKSPPAWLHVATAAAIVSRVTQLDRGEAEALALAHELKAAAVLMDEKKGRRIARQSGYRVIGTIAILELAAQKSLLDLKDSFAAIRKTSFLAAEELFADALSRDAARKAANAMPPQ